MCEAGDTERLKSHFERFDPNGTGVIARSHLGNALCELGMCKDGVERLFSSTCFVTSSGDVAYAAFVDWLVGRIPEDAFVHGASSSSSSGPCAASESVLHVLRKAKKMLCEGKPQGTVDCMAELEKFFDLVAPLSDVVQDRMRASWHAFLTDGGGGQLGSGAAGSRGAADIVDVQLWGQFAQQCVERLLVQVFSLVDMDLDGKITAQELMTMLMLITVQRDVKSELSTADAELIVQEFDICGDGMLSQAEFLSMAHALDRGALPVGAVDASGVPAVEPIERPRLLLYFDVNNTVLLADTLTGAGAEDLINMTLAGCAWGVNMTRQDGKEVWVCVCPDPTTAQPWQGLISYTEFVVRVNPFPASGSPEEMETVKQKRRQALRSFTLEGEPGWGMRPHHDRLMQALRLRGDNVLLPSFYSLLQDLKRAGRSFSVVFRSFGIDIDAAVEREFNDFCQGRHPLFPGLVLDGSDGAEDHRMNLSDPSSVGTFVRSAGDDGSFALVWGTTKQPPKGKGLDFYSDVAGTKVVLGMAEAAASLQERMDRDGTTLVVRDYYPGWSKAKFSSHGGKPLFLRLEEEGVLPIFFDDHIRPMDPNIVDPVDIRDLPSRVPMAQVYGIHCVRVSPLLSITDLSYFRDELEQCELAKAAQLARRRKVANMLHDAAALRGVVRLLRGGDGDSDLPAVPEVVRALSRQVSKDGNSELNYTPWSEKDAVKHAVPFVGIS